MVSICLGDPKFARGAPLGELCVLSAAQNFLGFPPWGGGVRGGVQVGRIPVQGRPTIISTHHPQGTKFS